MNGNHTNRSKMLSKPNSFVSGNLANDLNEYEKRMPLPFDRGGPEKIERDDTWNAYSNNYNYYGNGIYNNGFADGRSDMDYSRYHDQSMGYGSHRRSFNRTRTARFDPSTNSHNQNIDYGFQEFQN